MCGISGIINKTNQPVKPEEIRRINDLIIHRGPDDGGYYFGANFGLGHRRLSIIDLSQDGQQPMAYRDGQYIIVYNGEVYNYLELKEELIKKGYEFRSHTDTEVILAAYDKWGFDCVKQFNGMWAFAIYNKAKGIIFCSRDRFGVKPFYYTEIDNKFIFGSEIKQLLEYYPERFVNKSILIDYLVAGLEDHRNETFFENIFKLGQSHNLIYDLETHCFKIQRYYIINIDKDLSKKTEAESANIFKKGLESAISLRLRSDVKVGTCLSGGLDSSTVATFASRMFHSKSTERFTAITAKSSENQNDETTYAKMVVDTAFLDWHVVEPSTSDFMKYMDEVIETQEEPFGGPSIFMQYFVFKKAKELGCTVMLDGQGGDETLLGYERYYPAYLISQPFLRFIKGFIHSYRNSKLNPIALLSYLFYFTVPLVRLIKLKNSNRYLKKEYYNLIDTGNITTLGKKYKNISELQKYELLKTQLPHLLRYEDKNSMAHSIESRLPFLDYRLVEKALSINNDYKIKNGWTKFILRKSIENDLPFDIVWRKNKFGFESPKGWLKNEDVFLEEVKKSNIIREISQYYPKNCTAITWWRLYNIAKWEKIYKVKIK